jgi:hypothetical protein
MAASMAGKESLPSVQIRLGRSSLQWMPAIRRRPWI